MKRPAIKIAAFFSLIWIVLGALHCGTSPVKVAGGASGTEVSACTVTGIVVDSQGNAVVGGIVHLRSANYSAGSVSPDSLLVKKDTLTGTNGWYSFTHVPIGNYVVEAVFHDTLDNAFGCLVDSGESQKLLLQAVVMPMAVVSGSGLSKGTLVDALGLERQTIADYNGSFQIRVPAGWCRLSLQRSDSVHSSLDTLIYLQPGQHTIVNPLPQFSVCNSLQCELTAVRSILDFCGLQTVVPESVCVVADSHVVELHLRARLIRTLPETIGTLYLLRILDIGQNMLDSIPGSIGRFSHLQSLLADHNSLQIIPASIGMLDSLQLLDLSYNLLQTLPEPITYLRPIVMLRLGGNMLCNIGALTAQWADRYDNYWRSLQNCH